MFDFFAGMVVFLSIKTCANHHSTSTASDRGVTSKRRMSVTSPWIIPH